MNLECIESSEVVSSLPAGAIIQLTWIDDDYRIYRAKAQKLDYSFSVYSETHACFALLCEFSTYEEKDLYENGIVLRYEDYLDFDTDWGWGCRYA
jgi:hypothetical protein